MKLGRRFVLIFSLWTCLGWVMSSAVARSAERAKQADLPQADLVVYGGTASGVMTAYSAAREGLHVVLLEPGAHLGGMVTGGLSATDLGHFAIIGGYAREFYSKAAAHYGVQDLDRPENWLSEPHVDEAIFGGMLKEAGVEVRFHERLREKSGVEMLGGRIVSLTTEDGKRWRAEVFADCSYEGDVMAQSHVQLHVGTREQGGVWRGPGGRARTDAGASVRLGDVAV